MADFTVVHTETHDETKPAGTRARSLGDDDIREMKRELRERLAVDHQHYSDETGHTNVGTHKKVSMTETQVADPSTYDDTGYLYLKSDGTTLELYWKDPLGNVAQLTNDGYLFGDNIRLANNVYLKAVDAAGTGTVDLIKANASDKPVLPDESELASDSAPTTDVQITNKKYVDDKFDITTGHDHDGSDSKLLTGLGAWASKSADTVYQATTDGILIAYAHGTGNSSSYLYAYSDSNNPPVTLRGRSGTESGTTQMYACVVCPVKKSDYYKVTTSGEFTAGFDAMYFIPLGV
jgi:hypothetical protein